MDDAGGVRLGERVGEGHGVAQHVAKGESLAIDRLVQGLPSHILHGDEELAFGFIDIVDVNDVGVIETGGGFGLAHEAAAAVGIADGFGQQHFESDVAIQMAVAGFVDRAHAAFT